MSLLFLIRVWLMNVNASRKKKFWLSNFAREPNFKNSKFNLKIKGSSFFYKKYNKFKGEEEIVNRTDCWRMGQVKSMQFKKSNSNMLKVYNNLRQQYLIRLNIFLINFVLDYRKCQKKSLIHSKNCIKLNQLWVIWGNHMENLQKEVKNHKYTLKRELKVVQLAIAK